MSSALPEEKFMPRLEILFRRVVQAGNEVNQRRKKSKLNDFFFRLSTQGAGWGFGGSASVHPELKKGMIFSPFSDRIFVPSGMRNCSEHFCASA
jgi:hypothetical protein